MPATKVRRLPLRVIGTPGQRNDIAFPHDLIEGLAAEVAIADKGYDADRLAERIAITRTEVVIPPRRNRTTPRAYDAHLYRGRNRVEHFSGKFKPVRRVATRYDRHLANVMGS